MDNERNETLDLLKGYAIILVVLGHAVQNNLLNTFDSHPIFRLIYSFHMPLFMFISGYVSNINFKGTTKQLLSRVRTLLLPFFSWFLFSYFFFWAIHYNQQHQLPDFSKKLLALIYNPGRGLWFLWDLFFFYLFLYLSLKITKKHTEIVLFFIYFLINVLNNYVKPIGDMITIGWYLLFFLTGYSFKKYNFTETRYFSYVKVGCLLVFPLLAYGWSRNSIVQLSSLLIGDFNISDVLKYIYALSVPFAGIFMSFAIMGWVKKLPLIFKNIFLITGKISLEIYATHFYFFSLIFLISSFGINIRIIVTFIMVLLLTIGMQWILKTNKVTSYIFYGKLKNNSLKNQLFSKKHAH